MGTLHVRYHVEYEIKWRLFSSTHGEDMKLRTLLVSMAGCLVLSPAVSQAHHSFAAEFLADEWVTIEGEITQVWFKNPHVRYYVDVTDENGEVTRWDARTNAASMLQRQGWNKNTIKVGDKVTMKGNLGRKGKKLLSIFTVTFPDGTQYSTAPGSVVTKK
jgi:hypothetical protein